METYGKDRKFTKGKPLTTIPCGYNYSFQYEFNVLKELKFHIWTKLSQILDCEPTNKNRKLISNSHAKKVALSD